MAVIRQKHIETEIEYTEIVEEAGKMIKKVVTRTVAQPVFKEVDLYDEDNNIIGKYSKPVMEQYGTEEKQDEWVEIE